MTATTAMPAPRRPRPSARDDAFVGLLVEAPTSRPHGRHCACCAPLDVLLPFLDLLVSTEPQLAVIQDRLRTDTQAAVAARATR